MRKSRVLLGNIASTCKYITIANMLKYRLFLKLIVVLLVPTFTSSAGVQKLFSCH